MKNRFLEKLAELTEENKHVIADTGILATIGGLTSYGTGRLLNVPKLKSLSETAKLGVNGLTTLASDYATVKALKPAHEIIDRLGSKRNERI